MVGLRGCGVQGGPAGPVCVGGGTNTLHLVDGDEERLWVVPKTVLYEEKADKGKEGGSQGHKASGVGTATLARSLTRG